MSREHSRPKAFKSREKTFNKMTHDGLVERNAVTGEERRATAAERDIDLRTEQDMPKINIRNDDVRRQQPRSQQQTSAITQAQSDTSIEPRHDQQTQEQRYSQQMDTVRNTTSNTDAGRKRQQHKLEEIRNFVDNNSGIQVANETPPVPQFTPAQPSDTKTDTPIFETDDIDYADFDKPFEAAKPTERSYEAISHEKPAGPLSERFDISKKTVSATDTVPSSQSAWQEQTAQQGQSHKSSIRERLKFNPEQSVPDKKIRQTGTKYSQKFVDDAAKPEEKTAENKQADQQPTVNDVQQEQEFKSDTSVNIKLEVSHVVKPERPGKLQFVKDAAFDKVTNSRKKKRGKKRRERKQNLADKEQRSQDAQVPEVKSKDDTPLKTPYTDKPDMDKKSADNSRHIQAEKPSKLQFAKGEKADDTAEKAKPSVEPQKHEQKPSDTVPTQPLTNKIPLKTPHTDNAEVDKSSQDTMRRTRSKKPSILQFTMETKSNNAKQPNPTAKIQRRDRQPPAQEQQKNKAAPSYEKQSDVNDSLSSQDVKKQTGQGDTPETTDLEPDTEPPDEVKPHSRDAPKKPVKPQKLQFSDDEKTPKDIGNSDDKKLTKIKGKAEKADAKLDKARDKLSKKQRKAKGRKTLSPDEARKKPKDKFMFEKENLPPSALASFVGKGAESISRAGVHKLHQKVYEAEDDNVGVKAGHKAEQAIEGAYRGGKRITHSAYRFVKNKPYRTVARPPKKAIRAKMKYSYREALLENPKLKSNMFSRFMQKRKIKQQYAKALRDAKRAGTTLKKTGNIVAKATNAIVGVVRRHPAVVGTIAVLVLMLFIMSSMITSCSNMAGGGFMALIASSYASDDVDIDSTELAYTEWETDLQMKINKTEQDKPGYDEYKYNVDNISHNPYELMAYLTAVYQDFKYADIQADLKQLFDEQYQLEYVETTETRYRNNPDGTKTAYTWKILTINLTAKSFTDVAFSHMDSGQQEHYGLLMQTKGNRQYIESPFDFNWLTSVTSYYGYRVHPTTGVKDYHMGVDIAVPTGTDILAGHDGKVTTVANDSGGYGKYVVIKDNDGLEAKYAHCDSILVSVGQEVKTGDVIAKSGNTGNSTGPHLHLEVLKNGQYLNPLYFAQTNDDGSSFDGSNPPNYGDPGSPLGDGSYAALIAEAEKYLGFPYVFGGSSPSTSFDCSGFICWVYTKSGTFNLPRTTAQGIYNQCVKIPESEAKPGDLIFFERTYSTSDKITHVGIYVGGGRMLHCGNPIQYTSYMTSYWQGKSPSFGRLP